MVYGLCYICNKVATHTCRLCGRPVCDDHYISEFGVCTNCYKKAGGKNMLSGRGFKKQ